MERNRLHFITICHNMELCINWGRQIKLSFLKLIKSEVIVNIFIGARQYTIMQCFLASIGTPVLMVFFSGFCILFSVWVISYVYLKVVWDGRLLQECNYSSICCTILQGICCVYDMIIVCRVHPLQFLGLHRSNMVGLKLTITYLQHMHSISNHPLNLIYHDYIIYFQ